MGILGEDKAGKKGSDDGGEAYFFRGNTEKQTDAQGHDQMRIAGREPLQSRRDASHDARSYIDHEKGKADGFQSQNGDGNPVQALGRKNPDHEGEQKHSQHVVKDGRGQNDFGRRGLQQAHV